MRALFVDPEEALQREGSPKMEPPGKPHNIAPKVWSFDAHTE